jgi:hypothetical protein
MSYLNGFGNEIPQILITTFFEDYKYGQLLKFNLEKQRDW